MFRFLTPFVFIFTFFCSAGARTERLGSQKPDLLRKMHFMNKRFKLGLRLEPGFRWLYGNGNLGEPDLRRAVLVDDDLYSSISKDVLES